MKAAGYQYGREALENVRMGFEGAQGMRSWQPIESAPRDGSDVLLGHKDSVWVDCWITYSSTADAGYWADDSNGEATHWQPLPDPPKE